MKLEVISPHICYSFCASASRCSHRKEHKLTFGSKLRNFYLLLFFCCSKKIRVSGRCGGHLWSVTLGYRTRNWGEAQKCKTHKGKLSLVILSYVSWGIYPKLSWDATLRDCSSTFFQHVFLQTLSMIYPETQWSQQQILYIRQYQKADSCIGSHVQWMIFEGNYKWKYFVILFWRRVSIIYKILFFLNCYHRNHVWTV